MKYQIKNRWTGSVLFEVDTESLKLAVNLAVESDANLRGADLCGADLEGEKLIIAPIQIIGLAWVITITPGYIRIGCQRHEVKEWEKFTDEDIKPMHPDAVKFWSTYKQLVLSAHKLHKKEAGK